MKVILVEDVEKLGVLGDVVEVARGYARNYLFPRALAIEANDTNMKALEVRKRKREKQEAKLREEMKEAAEKINGLSPTIVMQAGEEDKLFGTVTTEQVAEAFSLEGITLDKKQIEIPEPIKKLGVYQINVKLHPEITASPKIWVVKK